MINRAVVSLLPLVPRSLVWKISRRYIAGKSLEEALQCVKELNDQGMSATLDVLGEDSTSSEQALRGEEIYQRALAEIDRQSLDANISVKLSMLALRFDESLCLEILQRLIRTAEIHDSFVRIDMEDSSVTEKTLDIYRRLRKDTDKVGAVVQAYLRSTESDVQKLLDEGDTFLRLCKGIYVEPEEIAFNDFTEIQDAFLRNLELMLRGGIKKVGIATHDTRLVEGSLDLLQRLEIPKERYEFQMLLGVTEKLRSELVENGHPLRVYVPFGEEWYAYSSRRLRENPKIAGHVIRNMLPF
ncbi:MAG: hypothetical protein CBC13_01635 [Planctomycetia bacterium TMED53]|nr:MAG: hypothetical protein CBC13_01635 [Planctomycetia bacterium TMED53]